MTQPASAATCQAMRASQIVETCDARARLSGAHVCTIRQAVAHYCL